MADLRDMFARVAAAPADAAEAARPLSLAPCRCGRAPGLRRVPTHIGRMWRIGCTEHPDTSLLRSDVDTAERDWRERETAAASPAVARLRRDLRSELVAVARQLERAQAELDSFGRVTGRLPDLRDAERLALELTLAVLAAEAP